MAATPLLAYNAGGERLPATAHLSLKAKAAIAPASASEKKPTIQRALAVIRRCIWQKTVRERHTGRLVICLSLWH